MFFIASSILAAVMAVTVIFVRLKATKKPASLKKIILPPLFMSTGFLMFLFPEFRMPWWEAGESFLVGCLFSIFLIKTSKFEKRGREIYLIRSKAFVAILISLFLIRMAMKTYLGHQITYTETSGLFFIVAFGMILPWRIAMYFGYQKALKS
ncbi:CcdC family protein [Fictibacillus sp. NRS-1165]|uniref:CcdC family protein n=1 Tax=Fictibacillus sp. NRS-1165 TaxID=3144463 RepID=UPI003D20A21E